MARRQTTTFSMSFLDVISCGFGAVVLFYTIIAAQAGLHRIKENTDLSADSRRLEQEVLDGYKHLAELRNALDATDDRTDRTAGASREMLEKLRATQEELSRYEHDTLARRESLERLKADLKQLEEGTRRLRESAPPEAVPAPLDREQLVTLRVDGRHVLVLVDASASMLDETLVNILRLRNMPPERRVASSKWRQAVNTVEWIAARLPSSTQFQVYAFDTAPRPVVEGTAGRWLSADDAGQIESALRALRGTAPTGGSSLQNAFAVISQLDPAPGQRDPRDRRPADAGGQAAPDAHAGDDGTARGPDAGGGEGAAAVASAASTSCCCRWRATPRRRSTSGASRGPPAAAS